MQRELKKELGLIDVFCIGTGAMVSSGLFILPAFAYLKSGPALIVAYLLAGIMVVPAMLSKAELATAMPRAGGSYFFIDRSFGPAIGSCGGMASWFSLAFKSAFALVGMGVYVALLTHVGMKPVAVGCCLFFILINVLGVKLAGRFQVVLVVGLLGILMLYVLRGLAAIQVENLTPFLPGGLGSLFATAGLVYVSYGGLTKVASIAEEVKNPGRNLPLGMILSLATVTVFYALVALVTVGVGALQSDPTHVSPTPISDGARVFMGTLGGVALAVAALFAFISTANAGLMSAARFPLAMSRDKLLPDFFQKTNRRFRTPHYAVVITGGLMILIIVFLELEMLIKVASLLMILLFAFVNLSVIIMRESKIMNYQPQFRSPLYPWMQIAGIIGAGFLVVEMGHLPLLLTALFFALALAWYWFYARVKVQRAFALVHVVSRITAKELTSYSLETELKEIIKERDEITEDRFDRLIKTCLVLDLERAQSCDEFFRLVSESLGGQLHTEPEVLFNQFIAREQESTTVIRPGLAIPHIVVPGESKFEVLVVRSREGITLSKLQPPVHAVFALAGSRDERPFHLRALMAIAQIVQQADFDKKWLAARNPQEMRDILLLGKRRRD